MTTTPNFTSCEWCGRYHDEPYLAHICCPASERVLPWTAPEICEIDRATGEIVASWQFQPQKGRNGDRYFGADPANNVPTLADLYVIAEHLGLTHADRLRLGLPSNFQPAPLRATPLPEHTQAAILPQPKQSKRRPAGRPK